MAPPKPPARGRRAGPVPVKLRRKRRTPRLPLWRRILGWSLVGLAIVLEVLNLVADAKPEVLPGGHSPLYFFLAIVCAIAGLGVLGVMRDTSTSSPARRKAR